MTETPTWPAILSTLSSEQNLSIAEAEWAMNEIMSGETSPARLAAFLVALGMKGETVDEVVGFRDAILEHALPLTIDPLALDIVGTGGDRLRTINVSTTAAIIASSAGVPVLKHGNRAASSSSGSSDVLAALGIDLSLSSDQVAEVFRRVGISFAFASAFHPGFAHAAPVRSELGIPTVFNFLGPLCNPARPEASAVGVADPARIPLIVGVFQTRGATALVFRGDDGLDELSTTGHSHVWEISRGLVTEHDLDPRELGIRRATIEQLRGQDAHYNASVLRSVLDGTLSPARDIALLNAAAGLVAYDLALDPQQASLPLLDRFAANMVRATTAVDEGAAHAKLTEWVTASNSFSM